MIKHGVTVGKSAINIEEKILCAYKNVSNSWQVIKIANIPNFDWEKTVSPNQTVMFEASTKAKVRVLSANSITAILTDTIPCHNLAIN